ncbi:MAG: NTP transferase domain-containing protein [Proteobacteria bacterium]|jgi:CTP:molybdopterin cytidylyltransferase MocA|nr:NTP transferase domain-containing protein [Pseudomonadota bacterium]
MVDSKYFCIILAAGEGRRAGGYKPLMELGEGLVIDRVVDAASEVAGEIRVVGGCEFARLEAHLARRWPHAVAVRNARWERGMFSSARAGLEGVAGAAFIHPADVPGPSRAIYRALAAAYEAEPRDVLRPAFGGRRGHPVLLSPAAVRAVLSAGPEATLREVLAPLSSAEVAAGDDLVLYDFDTLDELEILRRRLARGA